MCSPGLQEGGILVKGASAFRPKGTSSFAVSDPWPRRSGFQGVLQETGCCHWFVCGVCLPGFSACEEATAKEFTEDGFFRTPPAQLFLAAYVLMHKDRRQRLGLLKFDSLPEFARGAGEAAKGGSGEELQALQAPRDFSCDEHAFGSLLELLCQAQDDAREVEASTGRPRADTTTARFSEDLRAKASNLGWLL